MNDIEDTPAIPAPKVSDPVPVRVAILILALLSLVAFVGTLRGGFVWDDWGFIEGTWLEQNQDDPLGAFTRGSMAGSVYSSLGNRLATY